MPIYEYMCETCNEKKEIQRKSADSESVLCPDCKQNSLKRVFSSSVSVQFKGSGFYATDYCSSCCSNKQCDHS